MGCIPFLLLFLILLLSFLLLRDSLLGFAWGHIISYGFIIPAQCRRGLLVFLPLVISAVSAIVCVFREDGLLIKLPICSCFEEVCM